MSSQIPAADAAYYSRARPEILPLLPAHLGRVLEVGCGTGATLDLLKRDGRAAWCAGVEHVAAVAARAPESVDHVWVGDASTFDPPVAAGSLDAVLCLDVLEHLADPWAAVARFTRLLAPSGVLVASLPNVRNYKVVANLLLRGRFEYDPAGGIMDRTHLRFFTRASAVALVEHAGLVVDHVEVRGLKPWKNKWVLAKLSGGLLTDFFAVQYLIRARHAR